MRGVSAMVKQWRLMQDLLLTDTLAEHRGTLIEAQGQSFIDGRCKELGLSKDDLEDAVAAKDIPFSVAVKAAFVLGLYLEEFEQKWRWSRG